MPSSAGGGGGAAAAVSPPAGGRGRDGRPSCPGGMVAGWTGLAKPIFCFSSLSLTGILSYIRYNDLFAGKTDTPFFFWGTNGE